MKNIYKLIISIIIVQFAGIIGSIFTISSVSSWYLTITKPVLNPPSWIFGPVWITLYFMIGVSLFLVWKIKKRGDDKKKALRIFSYQLILNSLWSISFFGLQNPGLGLINILVLWLSIVWTMKLFYKVNKTAMYLLIPYLAWVSFATYLNYSIWILN